ncbi:hypothetical protein [Bacillus amyloliquefaciens]|uniref:Terminase n=1 Tax=Bacillus amyloliquefaciens TaxID=1390 RepID=A0AAP7TCV9_BACAM|nr:hypothetical protein [Bacillus amyloliquefaciens]OIK22571.1 hypothetical protein BKP66_03055 [Bacillus amyloliquefaciens]
MAYEEKTDWLPDDPINEDDVNRWEKGIKDAHKDLAAHKNDMNNPHKTTKAQIGLGNVDNVQQAAKKDFDQHNQDLDRHVTKEERQKWDNGQLTKLTDDSGKYLAEIQDGLDFHQVVDKLNQSFFFYTNNTGVNTPPLSSRGLYIGVKSDGEALAMDYEGGTWRKTLKASVWTDWVQLETSEGAQKKVDTHAKQTDTHVTKADKDRWNAGQLFKITADNGTQKINLTSGSFYDSLKDVGSVTFYGTNAVSDNPSDTSLRGMQLVGQPGIGNGYAVDVKGNAWWFYYNSNQTAINWYPIESVAGAQSKVDAHANKTDVHVTRSDKDKWNNAQLNKISNDDGQPLFNVTTDLHAELLKYPSLTYFSYEKTAANTPPAGGRGFWTCSVGKSYGHVLAMTNDNRTFRKSLANNIWSDWIELDSTEAAQKLIDAHANMKDIHVTQADKNMWNGAQLSKITSDNGSYLLAIGDEDNFLEKIVKNGRAFGTFYSTGKAANSPSNASTRGMFHFTSLDSEGKGTFGYVIAVDYKNNMFTNYLDLNLGWQGWRRIVTELDTENVPWINVPYKNGAKSGDRPLQYRKVGNTLHLNGHVLTDREVVFGSVPSSCAPAKGVVTMVAASGTTGYSKIIIYSNGDLKLTGIMANIENNVNGYYIDLVVALT